MFLYFPLSSSSLFDIVDVCEHCAFHYLLCCGSVSVLVPQTTTGHMRVSVCLLCMCVSIVMGVIDCLGSLARGQIYLLTLQIFLSSLTPFHY